MVIQHPTIADIQTTELIYYDSSYDEACYRFCKERDIDCLPDICNSSVYYRRNDDRESFDREQITDERRLDASTPIFQRGLSERFEAYKLLFVFTYGELAGVVHFSDYNHAIVNAYLYTQIDRYERDLRELLACHGLKNDDMCKRFKHILDTKQPESDIHSIYSGKIKKYEKKRDDLSRLPQFQSFDLRDLLDLAKAHEVIKPRFAVTDLRNMIMHAHQTVEMVNAHEPGYIYQFESFERFFDLATILLDDGQRIRNQLNIKRGLQ